MDETRKAFEAWVQEHGFDTSKIGPDRAETYESMFTRSMWWAWQAASAIEREACAKVCESLVGGDRWSDNGTEAADAIRARGQQ